MDVYRLEGMGMRMSAPGSGRVGHEALCAGGFSVGVVVGVVRY